jgi:hypothetical protein
MEDYDHYQSVLESNGFSQDRSEFLDELEMSRNKVFSL